jgi:CubicO group peptidase (beta-lactamase class C family)
MNVIRIFIWLLLFSGGTLCAAAPLLNRADLRQLIDNAAGENTPGLAVAVLKDGQIAFQRTRGLARMGSASPINSNTQFYLASLSKQFTSMAVAILEDRGLLGFDQALTNIFGDLPQQMHGITVDHLLRHTAGLGNYPFDQSRPDTNEEILQDVKRSKKLLFPPGTESRYSNIGYNILGTAVARVSGQPFPRFLSKEIFEPVCMTNTLVCTSLKALSAGRSVGYHKEKGKFEVSDYTFRTFGDGGIFSALNDMMAWCRAIEGHRLLKAEKQEQLFTPTILPGGKKFPYGRGWALPETAFGKCFQHGGALVGFMSKIVWYPDSRIWIIILTNRDDLDLNDLARKIMSIQSVAQQND